MDLTGLWSWIVIGVFLGAILWVQRRIVRVQLAAQREVLDRYKESLALQRENVELQRESIRLLGVIASKLDRN
jgi:hypothetical protein